MKKLVLLLFFASLSAAAFAFAEKKALRTEPLFQVGGGLAYSSIDLTRYTNTKQFKGLHARVVTHLSGLFYLSAEYSAFPTHASPSTWTSVHTRKFDLNAHVSFATSNHLTRIFVLTGIDRHEWSGVRTKFTDIDQLGKGLAEGTVVNVNRWGINFGCGISRILYDNIAVFADSRFNFANANDFEKVTIMDVMTTIGINFNIPHPSRGERTKTFGIGKKIYKWTEKGGK